jgi:hypothetical protein
VVVTTLATAAVLAAMLAAAPAALAQPASDLPPTGVGPRLEAAALGGAAGTSPEFGGLVSFPLGDRLAVDVGASCLTRIWRAPSYLLTQAQVRIPFKRHLRSRYSLGIGVTHLAALDERPGDSGLWVTDQIHPHVGASMEWPLGGKVDLRLDTQLVVQFDELMPVAPRIVAAFVWHPGRAR